MSLYVVVHGAWTGGWVWKRLRGLLQARGHTVFTPTLTGLGERSHLAHPGVDLDTHVQDVIAVLECEDLRDVVLIAHSYGGMVATGVMHRATHRIGRVVYLDAFVPRDGQCLFDLLPPGAADRHREAAARCGEGWRLPPLPLPDDTSDADVAWIRSLRTAQPLHTFDRPVHLPAVDRLPPRHFVYCLQHAPGDVFRPFAEQAKTEPGWQSHELAATHSPHVTAPHALCALLERSACQRPPVEDRGAVTRAADGAITARRLCTTSGDRSGSRPPDCEGLLPGGSIRTTALRRRNRRRVGPTPSRQRPST